MLDQNAFTETVREVSEIIRTASKPLSEEEILGYFAKMELNEIQKKMVLEYLLKPQDGSDSRTEEKKADMELPDSQALHMYMEEVEGLPVCAQEELQALYEKLLKGDATVIEKISESWMGRILEQAKKLSVVPEDFSDVVQEGNMALLMKLSELCGGGVKAGRCLGVGGSLDAGRGMYAVYVEREIIQAVEMAMKAYIQELTGEGDVENAVVGKVTLVNEARKHLMERNGQEPTLRELAEYTKMSRRELQDMMDMIQRAEERAKDRA